MTYKGTVQNGVVVLPASAKLPEGTEVDVTPCGPTQAEDPLLHLVHEIAKSRLHLPDDLAANHDYYLHGQDRKQQPRRSRWISAAADGELSEEAPVREANELACMAAETRNLPSDLAANHDHYLHGLPKR